MKKEVLRAVLCLFFSPFDLENLTAEEDEGLTGKQPRATISGEDGRIDGGELEKSAGLVVPNDSRSRRRTPGSMLSWPLGSR